MTARVHQARCFTPCPGRHAQEGLAQCDTVTSGDLVQAFKSLARSGGCRSDAPNRFGLDCGIHGDPLQLALVHGPGFNRNPDGFAQQHLQFLRPNTLAPTGHGGTVEGQMMLKMRLTAEGLMVRVLQPGGTAFFVAQALRWSYLTGQICNGFKVYSVSSCCGFVFFH